MGNSVFLSKETMDYHEVAENAKSGINHPNRKTATVIRSVKLVFRLLCNINNGKLKNNVDSLMV